MNIKIFLQTFLFCIMTLVISELSTSQMLTTATSQAQKQQQSFMDYIEQFFANIFSSKKKSSESSSKTSIEQDTKEQSQKTPTEKVKVKKIKSEKKQKAPEKSTAEVKKLAPLSRNEALEIIRATTGKIFDLDDPYHISTHLDDLKELTTNLDPVIDKKTITAIHFLIENQHRYTYLDTIFWVKNIKEKELDTSIPLTQKVFEMSKSDKLKVLRAKLAAKKPEFEAAQILPTEEQSDFDHEEDETFEPLAV